MGPTIGDDTRRQAALFEHEAEAAPPVAVEGPFAGVVFNRPIDQIFSYRIPAGLRSGVVPGQRVKVPLGRGNTPSVGYCVRVDDSAEVDPRRVKDVIEVLDSPPLIDGAMLDLTRWIASYYGSSWGQALDAVVPAGVKKQAGTRVWVCLTVPDSTRAGLLDGSLKLTPKQAEIVEVVAKSDVPLTISDVCKRARCGTGAVDTLRKNGIVHTVKRRMGASPPEEGAEVERQAPPEMTAEQKSALEKLAPALRGDSFATFLLHGVTGSGKTEVYLGAIDEVVARGREAIVLVPEISLTPQTIRRFRRRFDRVAVLHSHLSEGERHRHWRSIAEGEVQVVVGARSAVFAPTRKLGLIVIDEEHEGSFKQETVPRYHARDVAVKRAQLEGVPVILGSATPALETWRNAQTGRYTRIALEERVGSRPMPEVTMIDMRYEKPVGVVLSAPLRTAMTEALNDGGQVILLLNRRGFNTYAVCVNPGCRSVVKCRHCDVSLTYHQGRRKLVCHFCDAEQERIPTCPTCRKLLYYGGIGTERLEREVRIAFPDQSIRRMDSDTMRGHGSHEKALAAFKAGEVRILLGTQMIAKGLDFPNVTLVGVVDSDTALHLPDFRAAERTFQIVTQVAGRTGRGDRPGKVLVQTFSPDVPAIAHAQHHDYMNFVAGELLDREKMGLPPFGRLVRLIARGEDATAVKAYLEELHAALQQEASNLVVITAVVPAPVEKIRNLYRFHLRMRCPSPRPLQDLLKAVPPRFPPPNGVELAIDVDPMSML
ncbi:replication restart helicase PriA [Tundrisphaera lichenicola]|uniref:replication restart helicase PriA n=1 Tax=Tundrisphaera lichenicola TaxID=2029860 RepID=UPI003EBA70FC